jgi:hypothetical protein
MAGHDSLDAMRSFVNEYGITFPQVVSEDGTLWARFGVFGTGQWLFLDDDGSSEIVPYDLDGEQLAERLDALLA